MKNLFLITLLITGLFFKGYSQPPGNRGMYFSGKTNSNVSGPSINGPQITMMAWFKTNAIGLEQAIVSNAANQNSRERGIGLVVTTAGKVQMTIGNNGNRTTLNGVTTLEKNKWYHVACTYDNSAAGAKLYLNGNLENSSAGGAALDATNLMRVGQLFTNGDSKFTGEIDEVKIFNVVRSQINIQKDMSDVSTTVAGLLAYWDFEQSTRTIATDVSLNKKDATVGTDCFWALRVTKTTDGATDQGSLRWAITEANTDTDTDYIDFSIQQASTATVSTITQNSTFPIISQPVILDGYTAFGSTPNTNTFDKGTNAQLRISLTGFTGTTTLDVSSTGSIIRGLSISGGNIGVNLAGKSNQLAGNFIGILPNNSVATIGNLGLLVAGDSNLIGTKSSPTSLADLNVLSGGTNKSIVFTNSTKAELRNNYINTNITGSSKIGSNEGIWIQYTNDQVLVENNVVTSKGSLYSGINITSTGTAGSGVSTNSTIRNNFIGVGADGVSILGNNIGVNIENKSTNTLIEKNIITNNSTAIQISATSKSNIFSQNKIYCNTKAININTTGNGEKKAPTIQSVTISGISGIGFAGDEIEIFRDSTCGATNQGKYFIGTTNVLSDNTWNFKFATALAVGTRITATATDTINGTSEFSAAYPAPVATAATEVTKTSFKANWKNTGSGNYEIDLSTDNKFTNLVTGYPKKAITDTFYIITGLTTNTSYYYRVRNTGNTVNSNTKMTSTFLPPGSGNALKFDGTTNYVTIPHNPSLDFGTGDFSMEAWVFRDKSGVRMDIISKNQVTTNPLLDSYYQMVIERSGVVAVYTSNGSSDESTFGKIAIPVNQWVHLAAVRSGSSMTIYVNGILDVTGTSSQNVNSTDNLHFGTTFTTSSTPNSLFSGALDEIKLWNRALTQSEIQAQMCKKITGSESGLVCYFRFDENKGTIVENKAKGSSLDGTIVGNPVFGISGAALGDVSAYNYSTAAGNGKTVLTNTDVFTATYNTKAVNQGVHVYKINEAPNSKDIGTGLKSLDTSRYFGVFPVGVDTFRTTYSYNKNTNLVTNTNESNLVLANRTNNTNTIWNLLVDSKVNTTADTVTSGKRYNQNEFMAAFKIGKIVSPVLSSATDVKETSFVAHWSKVPDATTYYLDVATDTNFTSILPAYQNLEVLDTLKLVSGLIKDSTYFYRVRVKIGTSTTLNSDSRKVSTTILVGSGNAISISKGFYVRLPEHNEIKGILSSKPVTMEAWLKPSAFSNAINTIFSKGTVFSLNVNNSGVLSVNTNVTTVKLALNEWSHVAISVDPLTKIATVYLNGLNVYSSTINFAVDASAFHIGANVNGGANFSGQMDEVRVWNLIRSQSELQAAMCHTLKGKEAGLVVYFPMNDLSGSKVENKAIIGTQDGLLIGTNASIKEKSGAPIGDISVSLYDSSVDSLVLNDGDKFRLNGVYDLIGNKGIHLYKTTGDCGVTKIPSDFTSYDKSRYFGIFRVNYIYGITHQYSYESNSEVNSKETLAKFLVRQNSAVDSLSIDNYYTLKNYDTKKLELYGNGLATLNGIKKLSDIFEIRG